MAFEYWNPASGSAPEWVGNWNSNAFRKLIEDSGFVSPNSSSVGGFSDIKAGGGEAPGLRNAFYDYLRNNGMQIGLDSDGQFGNYQVINSQGAPVANESFNSGGMLDLAMPVMMAIGANYLMPGLGGAEAAASAAGAAGEGVGLGSLGAGGSAVAPLGSAWSPAALGLAEGLAPAYSAAELASLSAALPSLEGITAGAAGAAGAASGGGSGGLLGGMSSADKAALLGSEGYGAGMTGAQTGAFDTVLGATGSPTLANTVANSGLGSSVINSGIGQAISGGLNAIGGLGNVLPILGAVAGASEAGKGQSASTQSQIDPRMQQYLYGTGVGDPNSALGALQKQFQSNPTGINPMMQQGLDMRKAALTDPAYSQAYQQMRSVGSGLLGGSIAGNPFMNGNASLNNQQQTSQAGGAGGLLGRSQEDRIRAAIAQGRGLLGA